MATGQSDRTCCDYHLVQRLLHYAGHEWLVVGSDLPDAATENASYKSHRRGGRVLVIVDTILSGERDPGKLAKRRTADSCQPRNSHELLSV